MNGNSVESMLTLSICVQVSALVSVLGMARMCSRLGNTFVLKSSEKSPLALAAYGDLINEV